MNATVTTSTPPADAPAGRDRSRLWSALCAGLFIPAFLAAVVVVLSSERAGRCLTYGEGCHPALPGALFVWSTGVGVVACIAALATPVRRVRQVALAAQLLAECTALLVILSYA
ncbi:hypothetical protein ACWGNM_03230 [Streptomyces sp. NPDC055796]